MQNAIVLIKNCDLGLGLGFRARVKVRVKGFRESRVKGQW